MSRDIHDEQMADLIGDAVADVHPTDRLSELRARTANSSSPRHWWITVGGAALATAAAVTAVAMLSSDPVPTVDPGPVTEPTGTSRAVPAYFVGDTPQGPRLYREFQRVVDPQPGLAGLKLLESGAMDPDYRSLWPEGSFDSVSELESGVVTVALGPTAPDEPTALALQQLVYTVSAGLGAPVTVDIHPDFDLPVVVAEPQLDVLSRVNLSDPSEGQLVDDTLAVEGRANSFEANVLWTIEQGGTVMGQGFMTADGYMGARLFPFSDEIDVSSLDPGTYTLIVETDDPSGGAEGIGSFTDTRTFVLE